MKIEQLRYFVSVARTKSINRAADALHIAQPALSRHLQQLEDELNVKLLVRNSKGTTLTKAGEGLLKDSVKLLDMFDDIKVKHTRLASPVDGKVTVVMPIFVAKLLALPLVHRIEREAPDINLHIIEDTQSSTENEQMRHLEEGWYDLVLSYGNEYGDGIKSAYLADESFFLVFNACNDPEIEDELALSDALSNRPIYIPPYHIGIRTFLEDKARAANSPIHLSDEFETWDMIKHQIRSATGCTIAPLAMAQTEVDTNELSSARIVHPEINRKIHLFTRSGELNNMAVAVVSAAISDLTHHMIERGFWEFSSDNQENPPV